MASSFPLRDSSPPVSKCHGINLCIQRHIKQSHPIRCPFYITKEKESVDLKHSQYIILSVQTFYSAVNLRWRHRCRIALVEQQVWRPIAVDKSKIQRLFDLR